MIETIQVIRKEDGAEAVINKDDFDSDLYEMVKVERKDLPLVADLQDLLQRVTSIEEVQAMMDEDDRKTAQPIYRARLAELEE